jgi:hypothetical protein
MIILLEASSPTYLFRLSSLGACCPVGIRRNLSSRNHVLNIFELSGAAKLRHPIFALRAGAVEDPVKGSSEMSARIG